MERPTPAQIQQIIDEASRARSRALGELLSRGLHAASGLLRGAVGPVRQAAAMTGVRSPQQAALRLREFERNPG